MCFLSGLLLLFLCTRFDLFHLAILLASFLGLGLLSLSNFFLGELPWQYPSLFYFFVHDL